jgi:chemotaxis protein CheZ
MNAASHDTTHQQLEAIARQLQEALRALGYDRVLHEVAQEIPDARDRLAYVGEMTERAAHKVLGLVDQAKPDCSALVAEGEALLAQSGALPATVAGYVRRTVEHARAQQDTLNDIMMTQDFQDLSGQVIQKVIGIITRTEAQLQEMLEHSEPPEPVQRAELAGPQVPDKALQQDDVDDLLASLGF